MSVIVEQARKHAIDEVLPRDVVPPFARDTGLAPVGPGELAADSAGGVVNAAGAVAWAVTMALLGYFFGKSFDLLHQWLGRGGAVLLGVVVVLVGLPYALRRLRKLSLGAFSDRARAQMTQGLLAAALETICIALIVFQAEHRRPNRLDRATEEAVLAHSSAAVEDAAEWLAELGSLPVVTLIASLVVLVLWRCGRSRREIVSMLMAWFASEAIGLLLVGLLRYQDTEPIKMRMWPFGFAGSVPLRAFAVHGMAAWLMGCVNPRWRQPCGAIGGILIALATVGVVWAREQALTEALLELAAGGVVLFALISWLEGYARTATAVPNQIADAGGP
jgi:hypothetical protein